MAINWNQLLLELTDDDKAVQVPQSKTIQGTVSFGSYYGPVRGGVLRSSSQNFLEVAYPTDGANRPLHAQTDLVSSSILVGIHVQILEGQFSSSELNDSLPGDISVDIVGNPMWYRDNGRPAGDVTPGPVAFDSSVLLADADGFSEDKLVPATRTFKSRVDIPPGTLTEGVTYTARARAILAYPEVNDEEDSRWYVFDSQARPYYTLWGEDVAVVDVAPSVSDLKVNGEKSPQSLDSTGGVRLGFVVRDPDGPSLQYRIQVGDYEDGLFNASLWDSGWVTAPGSFSGRTNLSGIVYQGHPLTAGGAYFWRVKARDGLREGVWSDVETFGINSPPRITSLKVDGQETLYGSTPFGNAAGPVVSWAVEDNDGEQQRYELFYRQDNEASEKSVKAEGNGSSVTLGSFSPGRTVYLRLVVEDEVEPAFVAASFVSNSAPVVTRILTESQSNPTDLSTTTPIFTWSYQDIDSDAQEGYRVQVASDVDFNNLVWDTGQLSGTINSVQYGSTPSPVTGPDSLSHGVYFLRASVYDGITWSSLDGSPAAFFAINEKPNAPTIVSPTAGSYPGAIKVAWMPASTLDADGDTVTYVIEVTESRSTGIGWRRVAGPLPQSQTTYVISADELPSGNDYGVRVVASDGMASSDTATSTSPVFTVANHAPNSPVFSRPASGQTVSRLLRSEWVEASPVDTDGDLVTYRLEITSNASGVTPKWRLVDIYGAGVSSSVIDVSDEDDGTDYRLRITAIDEHGEAGDSNMSPRFSVANKILVSDIAVLDGTAYVTTSDGRLLRMEQAFWQVDAEWNEGQGIGDFEVIKTGGADIKVVGEEIQFLNPRGETALLREK